MNLSSFLIRIIFLALPGIVGSRLYRTLERIELDKTKKKDWEDFIEIVFFSLASYAIYGFIAGIVGGNFTSFQALFNENIPISWYEVIITSLISIPLAFISSFVHHKKLINKLGRLLKVTRKFGDDNVWEYFFNSPKSQTWVFVRDHKLDLCYFGFISAYSDSEQARELLLEDVSVYNNATSDYLYKSNAILISRDTKDLSIEIPIISDEAKGNLNE